MKKNINKIILATITSIVFPFTVFAQGNEGISEIVNSIYTSALSLGGVLAFIMILIGAIYFTVSGSSDKKNEGKDYITSALWGLVLLFGAYLIFNTVNPQITTLQPPSGESIVLTSCSEHPEKPECGPTESPFDDEGTLVCCNRTDEPRESCDVDVVRTCRDRTSTSTENTQTYSDILKCEGDGNDCSDAISYQSVNIEAGGAVQYWMFYPQNVGVSGVECAVFAYKESPTSTSWTEPSRVGLEDCF